MAEIGFETEECVVAEDDGELEVCVVIHNPLLDCPVVFPFELMISTTPGTAGVYIIIIIMN